MRTLSLFFVQTLDVFMVFGSPQLGLHLGTDANKTHTQTKSRRRFATGQTKPWWCCSCVQTGRGGDGVEANVKAEKWPHEKASCGTW